MARAVATLRFLGSLIMRLKTSAAAVPSCSREQCKARNRLEGPANPHILLSATQQSAVNRMSRKDPKEGLQTRDAVSPVPPIIVGGTGGSGTRVVQSIIEKAGVFMGTNLNVSKDAMDFEPFLDEMINVILTHTRRLNYDPAKDLPPTLALAAANKLRNIAVYFRRDIPNPRSSWGWKNPRSIYVLPIIDSVFPGLHFVHVIRDGRDMAFSQNQNQLQKHFSSLFARPIDDIPVDSIRLWAKANTDIAEWAANNLEESYIRVRFEDLCEHPSKEIKTLVGKLAIRCENVDDLASSVQTPETIGRWRKQDNYIRDRVEQAGKQALEFFGYV